MKSTITIYTDGAARGNPGPSASGYMVYRDSEVIGRHFSYNGVATNNYAEYRAIILALEWCRDNLKNSAQASIKLYSDSELVVRQMNGDYKVKSSTLLELNRTARSLLPDFERLELVNIGRENRNIVLVDKQLNALLDRMEKRGVRERYKLDNGQSTIEVD